MNTDNRTNGPSEAQILVDEWIRQADRAKSMTGMDAIWFPDAEETLAVLRAHGLLSEGAPSGAMVEAAAKARGEALIEAVQAHRNLHRAYASTSVCRGGIGGQAITSHCGEVCDNYEAHEKDTEAWTELEVEAIDYSSARAEAYRQERKEQ